MAACPGIAFRIAVISGATYVYLWWHLEIFSVKLELKLAHGTVTAYHHTSSNQLQTSAVGAMVQGYEYSM